MNVQNDHDEELEDLVEDEATQQESESSDNLGVEKRKIFTDKSDPTYRHPLYAIRGRRPYP